MSGASRPRRAQLPRRRIGRISLKLTLAVVVAFLVMTLFEGTASLLLFAQGVLETRVVSERLHTEYDADLGWINLPNHHDADHYGPGRGITTNGQRFRNKGRIERRPPAGKLRVVCSGDSFTLGYGVDDDQTWVHLLGVLDPRLESVNMGQGGYGIDQAYLWFRRDFVDLELDLHLFAFISDDFVRMEEPWFLGYPKPYLGIAADGSLQVLNTPVPKHLQARTVFETRKGAFQSLAVVRLARAAGRRLSVLSRGRHEASPDGQNEKQLSEETWRLAVGVFSELQALNEQRGSRLVLVYLPTGIDVVANRTDLWRDRVAAEAIRLGCGYVDLVPRLRELDDVETAQMFLEDGEVDYWAASGHYSAVGNRRVAEWLVDSIFRPQQPDGQEAPSRAR